MKKQIKMELEPVIPVIQPSVRHGDEKHILETMFQGDQSNLPELKGVGYVQLEPGANKWMSYTITTKGSQVTKIEVDEPDLRAIAEDNSKTQFVNLFMNQE